MEPVNKQELLDLLKSMDLDSCDIVIFKDEEGKGKVCGVLIGSPELLEAVAEGFTCEDEDLDYTPPDKEEIIH